MRGKAVKPMSRSERQKGLYVLFALHCDGDGQPDTSAKPLSVCSNYSAAMRECDTLRKHHGVDVELFIFRWDAGYGLGKITADQHNSTLYQCSRSLTLNGTVVAAGSVWNAIAKLLNSEDDNLTTVSVLNI